MNTATQKKRDLTPADDFTARIAAAAGSRKTPDGEYEYMDIPPEEAEDYEEIAPAMLEEELAAVERAQRLANEEDFDEEREEYIASVRQAIEEGRVEYNAQDRHNTAAAMYDVLQVVMDNLDEDILRMNKELYGRENPVVSSDSMAFEHFLNNLTSVIEIIDKYRTGARSAADPKRMRLQIYHTVDSLCYTCGIVLRSWQSYRPVDIERIIAWYNGLYQYPEFLHLYKEDYFTFVVNFCNMELRKGADISDVYVVALNNLVNINIKVLNIILKEKSEQYAPVVNYVRKMKQAGQL